MIKPISKIREPQPSPIVFGEDKRVRINENTVLVYPETKKEPTYKEIFKDVFIRNTEQKNDKKEKSNNR